VLSNIVARDVREKVKLELGKVGSVVETQLTTGAMEPTPAPSNVMYPARAGKVMRQKRRARSLRLRICDRPRHLNSSGGNGADVVSGWDYEGGGNAGANYKASLGGEIVGAGKSDLTGTAG